MQIDLTNVEQLARTEPGLLASAIHGMTTDLMGDMAGGVLDAGSGVWEALAGIVLAWTGMRWMLGGPIQMGDVVLKIVVLMIPRTMLFFYGTPFPGTTTNFPQMVAAQGAWLSDMILQDSVSVMMGKITGISNAWMRLLEESFGSDAGVLDMILGLGRIASAIASTVTAALPLTAAVLIGLLCAALCWGQVMFAGFGLALVTVMGPLFIPWLVFPPMAFLFWGWLRSLIIMSLYAPIAAAVLRVFGLSVLSFLEPLVTPVTAVELRPDAAATFGLTAAEPGTAVLASAAGLVFTILFGAVGILAALRIPTMASGLVSGSGTGGGAGELVAAGLAVAGSVMSGAASLRGAAAGLGRVK